MTKLINFEIEFTRLKYFNISGKSHQHPISFNKLNKSNISDHGLLKFCFIELLVNSCNHVNNLDLQLSSSY